MKKHENCIDASDFFFTLKLTPVLGVVPNGKKYLFFPNAWFKIPNQAYNCNHNLYMYC